MGRKAEEPSGNWALWHFILFRLVKQKAGDGQAVCKEQKKCVIINFGGGKSETTVLEDCLIGSPSPQPTIFYCFFFFFLQ